MSALPLCLPNFLTTDQFLTQYWQKKPLLIKQGLAKIKGMFEPEDILNLAIEEEALARLIIQDPTAASSQWSVKKSPLTEADLTPLLTDQDHLAQRNWTVLIQNLEQWSPELGELWQAFDFIPQWQRDDIMVSFAPKGGSVGKHFDDYDVFLAQGFGSRRWQLGKYCNDQTEFIKGEPIRIFDDMGDIIFDEVLEAGDVLYVPPKLAHYGVALDDCLTFSFGFRRPNMMQVLDSIADVATTDPNLFTPLLLAQSDQSSGQLTLATIDQIKAQLLALLASGKGDELLKQALSEVVSTRQYDMKTPEEIPSESDLVTALAQGAVIQIDYNSRLIYTYHNGSSTLFANGQRLDDLSGIERQLLCRLADGEALTYADLIEGERSVKPAVITDWLENGWVWLK